MDLRMYVSNLLRTIGLLQATDRLRFLWQKFKNGSANKRFIQSHPHFEFPPPYFIYETYRLNYEHYYHDGNATAGELIGLVSKYSDTWPNRFNVLDWGSGTGRITRHLPAYLPAGSIVHGCDYNSAYIDWCKDHIPGINWNLNLIHPPLHFEDGFFNVVIGLSVFTHLSASNHQKWMEELYRVTSPGGIVLLSMQGNVFKSKLSASEKKQFDEGKLVVRESIAEGHRLFSSFHPRSYVQELIKHRFDICELVEASTLPGHQPEQDTWILKKKEH